MKAMLKCVGLAMFMVLAFTAQTRAATEIWVNSEGTGGDKIRIYDLTGTPVTNFDYPGLPSWTWANEHRWPPAHSLPSAPPPPQQRLLFIF